MEGLSHYEKDVRPWGEYERFTLNEKSTVKLITVHAGEAFSLQTHQHRAEFWRIFSGTGTITLGENKIQVHSGEHFSLPQGEKHRMEAGADGISFLEIAFGEFDENDIVRLEDKYGRI